MDKKKNHIFFDGECPFCKNYIKLQKFVESYKNIQLLNARNHKQLVKFYLEKGFNVDKGMILNINGKIFFGDEAIWYISKITTRENFFLKLQSVIFKNIFIAKLIYPILRLGRFTFFKIFSKKFITDNDF